MPVLLFLQFECASLSQSTQTVNVMDRLEVDSGWRDESKLLRQPTDFINKQPDSTTMNFQKIF